MQRIPWKVHTCVLRLVQYLGISPDQIDPIVLAQYSRMAIFSLLSACISRTSAPEDFIKNLGILTSLCFIEWNLQYLDVRYKSRVSSSPKPTPLGISTKYVRSQRFRLDPKMPLKDDAKCFPAIAANLLFATTEVWTTNNAFRPPEG